MRPTHHSHSRHAPRLASSRGRVPTPARIAARGVRHAPPGVLGLQRTAGNRAVGEMLGARGPGRPLVASTRREMESRFGQDFRDVRVHADARAAESARARGAAAFTAGRHIVFGAGEFAPSTARGRRLLAHELAHVVQQGRGSGRATPAAATAATEAEAKRAAAAMDAGSAARVTLASAPGAVQCQPADKNKDKTPEEIGEAHLATGPKEKSKEWKEATKAADALEAAEKAKKATRRVDVPRPTKHEPTATRSTADYEKEFKSCVGGRKEAGLPQAFLCAEASIEPPQVAYADSATFDTNVRLGSRTTKGGGEVWVDSASLPWALKSASYLDVGRIDPGMLSEYRTHEKGHAKIAERLRDHLARLMRAELERALPTEAKPLTLTGKDWAQKGVDKVIARIQAITTRYDDWWHELADRADATWDAQEKRTLSKIAAAARTHRPTAPTVADEEE